MARKDPFNPFYLLAMLSGIAFAVTACAFGWMMYLETRKYEPGMPTAETSPLLGYLQQHGAWLLLVELSILGIATVAALGWDRFWSLKSGSAGMDKPPSAPGS